MMDLAEYPARNCLLTFGGDFCLYVYIYTIIMCLSLSIYIELRFIILKSYNKRSLYGLISTSQIYSSLVFSPPPKYLMGITSRTTLSPLYMRV